MDDESDEQKDKLNVQSEGFDPLWALYSNKTIIPFPSAPVLDNVAKVSSLLSKNQDLVNKARQPVKKEKEMESSSCGNLIKNAESSSGATGTVRKERKNIFYRMNQAKGPLAFLRTCMEKRIRVKVWTRSAKKLRGHCLGFVSAFDKHWNLVLEDVHEIWTRRIKRKTFLLGKGKDTPIGWRAMGPPVTPPKVIISSGPSGEETCQRHVDQMLMRGEHIAFVSIPDGDLS